MEERDLVEELRRRLSELARSSGEGVGLFERLLERALERAREARAHGVRVAELAPKLLDALEGVGLLKPLEDVPRWDFEALGVDGSRQLIRGLGGRYYVFAATALVKVSPGGRSVGVEYPAVEVFELHDPSGVLAERAAEYAMLLLETATIDSAGCSPESIMMLDGPLADPPQPADPQAAAVAAMRVLGLDEAAALELAARYHRLRAAAIASKRCPVVGIVKRVSSHTLLSSLARRAGLEAGGLADDELARALAAAARLKGVRSAVIGPGDLCESMPPQLREAYCAGGRRVYYAYTFSPYTLRPYRVEVLSSDPRDAVRAAGAAVASTMPGHSLPLPVLLAHERSTIRRSTAMMIYREVVARLAAPEGDRLGDAVKALAALDMEGWG